MLRLRIFASVLSILALAAMALAFAVGAPTLTAWSLLAAAAVLAMVAPFDAPRLGRRIRVVLACLVHVAAIMLAFVAAHGEPEADALTLPLVALLLLGVGLALWAIATCNRRRMPRTSRYYDN